jgi:CheY-like chemotaxis protein
VLVVDDNQDAAETLAEALRDVGFITEVAFDGLQALQVAMSFRPQVALLDIGLPLIDGYEVARRMREQTALAGIRLVAVTGYGQPSDRARALAAGFEDHLVKPVALAAVESLLRDLGKPGKPGKP